MSDSIQHPQQQNYIANSSDEISLVELIDKANNFVKYLKTKWLQLLLAGLIGGLSGIGYYYTQSPKYVAECTFILDEKSSGGGLASLASSFGVDAGSLLSGGGSLFSYDNLLDILKSRRIIESVLLSEVDTAKITHLTLADLYLAFSQPKKAYNKNKLTEDIHFHGYTTRNNFAPVQDSILYNVYKRIIKQHFVAERTSKKTQIFKVSITSQSEVFSKLMAERIVEETKKLYISIKTGTSQRNVDRLQAKADSLLNLLNGKSYELAETQIVNANPTIKTLSLPSKFAARNELVISTLYTEIVKNLETAKTSLMLQTPVIQNLDSPRLPLEDNKTRKLFSVLISSFLSNILYFIYLIIKYFNKLAI